MGKPDDLGKSIADWLNKQKDALPGKDSAGATVAADRLRSLLLTWGATGANVPVIAADLAGDGRTEVITTLAESWTEMTGVKPDHGYLLVLVPETNSWTYNILRSRDLKASSTEDFLHPSLLKVGDLNADKLQEIVFTELNCGSQACATTLHVLNWAKGKFGNLTPDAPAMATAQVGFENTPGSDFTAITLTGGTINSTDAVLQRPRTEYRTWDPDTKTFKLTDTRYATSSYLYFRVIDGNYAMEKQNLTLAETLYKDALYDTSLKLWFNDIQGVPEKASQERAVLTSFARFRLALVYALQGDQTRTRAVLEEAQQKDFLYSGWAKTFSEAYLPGGAASSFESTRVACAATIAYSRQHVSLLDALNRYGPSNPTFTPDDICPVSLQ